jgi:hypothetical protein
VPIGVGAFAERDPPFFLFKKECPSKSAASRAGRSRYSKRRPQPGKCGRLGGGFEGRLSSARPCAPSPKNISLPFGVCFAKSANFAAQTQDLQQHRSYQRLRAWALLLFFAAMWSLKTAHGWLSHDHSHADHPVCEVAYDHHKAHLHDERYANEDCSMCAFVVSVTDAPPVWSAFDFSASPKMATILPFFYEKPLVSAGFDLTQRRGPPAA